MKLHLPCGLRSALLACFALTCTTPAWALDGVEWSQENGVYNGYAYFWSGPYDVDGTSTKVYMSTVDIPVVSETNANILRPATANTTTGTIEELTLTGGKDFIIQSNPWQNDCTFSGLHINSILLSGTGSSSIQLTENNVLNLGDLTGAASTPVSSSDITFDIDGTLNLNYNYFAGGLDSLLTDGSGTLVLHGTVDWTDDGSNTVVWSKDNVSTFNVSNVDISNLTLNTTNADSDYLYSLKWDADASTLSVLKVQPSSVGCTVTIPTEDSKPIAVIDYTSESSLASGCKKFSAGLEEGFNASTAWTFSIHGKIDNVQSSVDRVLISSVNLGTGSASTDYAAGNFSLYMTSDGKLYLHHDTQPTAQNSAPTSVLLATLTAGWTSMEYNLVLSYNPFTQGQTYHYMQLSRADSSIVLNDGSSVEISALTTINIGAAPSSNLMENLWTRLPNGSTVSVSDTDWNVLPDKYVTWELRSSGVASVEDLQNGVYSEFTTGESVQMSATDTIKFMGGTLSTEGSQTLKNPIEVADGATVVLAPGAKATLTLENGQAALNTSMAADAANGIYRLEVNGGTNAKVVLKKVTATELTDVKVAAKNTLELNGSKELTIDASRNSFDSTATLIKSGSGKLTYIAKQDDQLNSLRNANNQLEVRNALSVSTITAGTLQLITKGASVNATGTVSASVQMDGTNGAVSLTAGSVSASSGSVNMFGDATLNATSYVSAGSAYMAGNSSISAEGISGGKLTMTGNAKVTVANKWGDGGIYLNARTSDSTYTGAINVQGNAALSAQRISASSLTTGAAGSASNASVETGVLDLTASGGSGALGMYAGSTVTATGDMSAKTATIKSGATLAVGGKLNISGAVESGGTIYTPAVKVSGGSMGSLSINGGKVTADGVKDTTITFDKASLLSTVDDADTAATPDFVFDLKTAENTTLTGTGNTAVSDVTFTNSSITVTDGALTLTNTSHDAGSSISTTGTGAALTATNVALVKGSKLTVGSNTYTVQNATSVTLSGSATEDTFTLSKAAIDVSSVRSETEGTIVLNGGSGSVETDDSFSYTLKTAPGMEGTVKTQGGHLVFTLTDVSDGILQDIVESENAAAVASAMLRRAGHAGGVLADLYDYIRNTDEHSRQERAAVLNQLSTGSLTMMADSQRRGVTNTLNNLRNRVVQMGNPQGYEPEKNIHAWIEADGSYNDIDQDGGAAGYEYSTYGGTVGAHMDVGNYSFGAAISASYGELTAHSADHAEGDHDTVTFSAFARHQHGAWTQLGILSFGRNELDMSRTVAGYHADGEANGHTITAYYEAGYSFVLDEEGSHVLQPHVSAMLTSASMGGITETGSIGNAGLCSDSEDYVYGTVGIGFRYQVVLAQDVNERLSFLELRAKLVQDFGDDTNEVNVHFAGLPGTPFRLKGADVGSTGFQFGAGLSVPVDMYKTLFADVDADIRSGASSVNGSVGIRVQF